MKSIGDILGLKRKKSLRLGLLLLSTVFIISASALVYSSMIYEKALNVGNTSGVTTGSAVSFTPYTVIMLAVLGLIVGLSMFGFLREASKHIANTPGGLGSSPTGPLSMSPGEPGIGLPSHLHSMQEEEWEESPRKNEGEE